MPYPGVGFPIPPFSWPHVGRQWPEYNLESEQAEGLAVWWPTLASAGASLVRDLKLGSQAGVVSGTNWSWKSHGQGGMGLDFALGTGKAEGQGVDLPTLAGAAWSIVVLLAPRTYVNLAAVFGFGKSLPNGDPLQQRYLIEFNNNYYLWGGAADWDTGIAWDADNQLHHVVIISDGTNVSFFRDGILRAGPQARPAWGGAITFITAGSRHGGGVTSGQFTLFDGRIYNRALPPALIYQMAHDARWELHSPPPRRWVLAPVGGVLYQQAVAGVFTPAGAIIKRTATPRAGTLTTAGALARRTAKPLAGTLTTAGVLVRKAQKALAGTLTTAGALVRKAAKPLAGTLTTAGAVIKETALSFAGTLTPSGALIGKAQKILAGTLTTTGAITRTISKSFAGTLTTAGTAAKRMFVSLAGTLTTAGAVAVEIVTIIPIALTLWTRSMELTLKDRTQALTLWARNLDLTLRDRE